MFERPVWVKGSALALFTLSLSSAVIGDYSGAQRTAVPAVMLMLWFEARTTEIRNLRQSHARMPRNSVHHCFSRSVLFVPTRHLAAAK